MNIQPYIVQSALAARHDDLVRQADVARLATRSASRRHLSFARLRLARPRREWGIRVAQAKEAR